jgi:hypothetical protein
LEPGRNQGAHGVNYLAHRLSNCGDAQVQQAGAGLDVLRDLRNQADYDLYRPVLQNVAGARIQLAERIIQLLDGATQEPPRTAITDAMKIYERDVLKDVTWHP